MLPGAVRNCLPDAVAGADVTRHPKDPYSWDVTNSRLRLSKPGLSKPGRHRNQIPTDIDDVNSEDHHHSKPGERHCSKHRAPLWRVLRRIIPALPNDWRLISSFSWCRWGGLAAMTRLLWQHPGVAGRPYPGSGENDDDHQTRDDPLERIPLAGSSRPLPQVVAGLARPPRLLLLLCAFLFGVAGTSPATTPVR